MQTLHGSHALKHDFTGVQGWQAAGSAIWAASQLPVFCSVDPSQTNFPLSAGSSQQPKQSQPFGVSGKQLLKQAVGWVALRSSQVARLPGTTAFGLWTQLESPLGG
jgi:hypothetical protein